MGINNIKISLKMKNRDRLSIEKNIAKKTPIAYSIKHV